MGSGRRKEMYTRLKYGPSEIIGLELLDRQADRQQSVISQTIRKRAASYTGRLTEITAQTYPSSFIVYQKA
jgi:hypothetical protein